MDTNPRNCPILRCGLSCWDGLEVRVSMFPCKPDRQDWITASQLQNLYVSRVQNRLSFHYPGWWIGIPSLWIRIINQLTLERPHPSTNHSCTLNWVWRPPLGDTGSSDVNPMAVCVTQIKQCKDVNCWMVGCYSYKYGSNLLFSKIQGLHASHVASMVASLNRLWKHVTVHRK